MLPLHFEIIKNHFTLKILNNIEKFPLELVDELIKAVYIYLIYLKSKFVLTDILTISLT